MPVFLYAIGGVAIVLNAAAVVVKVKQRDWVNVAVHGLWMAVVVFLLVKP